MQEVCPVEGEAEANKRKRKLGRWSPSGRLRQALFLSGMTSVVGMSVFVLVPKSEGADADIRNVHLSGESQKELCLFRLEQKLLESPGTDGKEKPEAARTDAMRDCADIVSGKDVFRAKNQNELEEEIRSVVSGYPIEVMTPSIASYGREIAALLVGIAKKESSWGEHVPLDSEGKDCFNYWGYKGAGTRGTAMGHGCFGSPEEAVRTVGNRLVELVALRRTSDPRNMIVWKCGSSCAGHSPESVRKWIADVSLYYGKIARL
jgi:hypothetical protein